MAKKPEWMPSFEPVLYDYKGRWDKRWFIKYQVWDTDLKKFVFKRKYIPNITPVEERKKVAKQALKELNHLLANMYMAGEAPYKEEKFDLEKLTIEKALIYYVNYKNSATATGDPFVMVDSYNEGIARVSKDTWQAYRTTLISVFLSYLRTKKKHNVLLKHIGKDTVQDFFAHLKQVQKRENKTLNNYRGYISSFFNYFIRVEELPVKNMTRNVEKFKEEDSERHPPFSQEQLQLIAARCEIKGEQQLLLFIRFIYFLFIRPRTELRLLKVGDIREKTVYIRPSNAKNDKGQHITIPDALEEILQQKKIREYPEDYYVFTHDNQPGKKPVGPDYFYQHHRRILKELGYEKHTMYGYKHTGAINLYLHTRDIEIVKRHCRHSSQKQTEEYLRELGVLIEEKVLNFRGF